ncbi:MAG TPA: DEAD/DEAH box helicase [Ktedonobacteraceae bacterium]|nr:DEAD/DEAH box helicase [Ktedonobacteraceae bacterium]
MSTTVLDLRGRDLIIIPPKDMLHLPTEELQQALFGDYLPTAIRIAMGRDKRQHFLRTLPMNFSAVKSALRKHQTPFSVAFEERPALPFETLLSIEPRPYQEEALTRWLAEGSAGVVVLPTGAGKTLVAAMAIHETGLWTLVVVPTLDLLQQWRNALIAALGLARASEVLQADESAMGAMMELDSKADKSVPSPVTSPALSDKIGVFGGGDKDIRPVTIITYDSAALYPRELRRFGLLIFDECHHLPAPTYRLIAESAFTPLRLGLSATPERSDMAHVDLDGLIGLEVYRRSPSELTEGRFLAQYQEVRIDIALSSEDEARYAVQRDIYRSFLRRRRISINSPEDFQKKLIFLSARDPEAREAMLAWREARSIAMNAPAKYAEIERLLRLHASDQVILFSEYNPVVEEISRRFCLPNITYKTPAEERRIILERFRTGQYSKLVTGRVLNEGVDVPDCRVAIIVSGNSTRREYIQRLGRVLRPKLEQAVLYELVTAGTTEEDIAKRRR